MARAGIGVDLAGLHAVAAAVASGRVERITVERQRMRQAEIAGLLDAAARSDITVEVADDVRSIAGTDNPQGVVARARPIEPVAIEQCIAACRPAAIVVLDHVEDPRNVGAVVRSMVAAGVLGLVVPDRRAAPLGATAFKAAAGAFEALAITVVGSIPDALRRLSEAGVWTVGLEGSGEKSLFGLELLSEPCALVLGAEGDGLSRLVRDRVDVLASIAMSKSVESLNVSAASAIACFELARSRGWIS